MYDKSLCEWHIQQQEKNPDLNAPKYPVRLFQKLLRMTFLLLQSRVVQAKKQAKIILFKGIAKKRKAE